MTRPPAAPLPLEGLRSIFNPMFAGIDEFGHPVEVSLIFRNWLLGGEPGAGKSAGLNLAVAHAAVSLDCQLVLLDGKQVELGQWRRAADEFVGPDQAHAIRTLQRLQTMMDHRYTYLLSRSRRKIRPDDGFKPYLVAVDEIAFYSTLGEKKFNDQFASLLRDLVARGRAVGLIVVAATQRPSSDIIPTSLRDLFAWRFAGRCTTDVSSDIVLGHGWASRGFSSNRIATDNPGAGLLIAEGGVPRLVKLAYLSDDDIGHICDYAVWLRQNHARPAGAVVAA